MHDTALAIGAAVMAEYTGARPTIVEIGAMNVNGTLRSVAPAKTKYIGIDQQSGPGVDVVVPPGADLPVATGTADLVMASSVFEHDMMFWETFGQMCRLAKPGGYIYLNVPSNGCVHSFPVDCWRFYPDAGLALERYSAKTEWPVKLIESFVAERQNDQWNDFVAIFQRLGGARKRKHTHIYSQFDSKNVFAENVGQRINLEENPEDIRIAHKLRLRSADLEATISAIQGDTARLSQEVATRGERIVELEGLVDATQSDAARLSQEVAVRDSRISELEASTGTAQSEAVRLSQEVAARDSRINELEASADAVQAEVTRLSQDLAARDSRIGELGAAVGVAQDDAARLLQEVAARDGRIAEFEATVGAAQDDAARLSQEVAVRDSRIGELEAIVSAAQGEVTRLSQEAVIRDGRVGELEAITNATQGDVTRLSLEITTRSSRVNELEANLTSARNETQQLTKELAVQIATVAELRRFVTTLGELALTLGNNPKASWNPFRLFRRTDPPILLGRAETEALPLQPPNKP
ncbi:MAG: hypothetical protein ABS35_35900 [Kaistia sp. SCN 65-12]|nr:MAG: hypothetical protein ABS35_35900 [Kaistia sp. SCN 65-12]